MDLLHYLLLLLQNIWKDISVRGESFITHIGRNAIFYYFAQGIGSSLNYYVVDILQMSNWFVKWCITFSVNVIITVCIAELLRKLYIQVSYLYIHCIHLLYNQKLFKSSRD